MPQTKFCAVAFADIASSTRMFRELGDAAARELTAAFGERVSALLPRFQGRLVKAVGDEVMCVFPEGENAVLAMSALHKDIAISPPSGHALRLHTGVNYGRVIVEGDDCYGTTVNVAAYLSATARAEQILATQGVVDRLSPASKPGVRAIYSTQLKGEERDSIIYEVVWQLDPAEITALNVGPPRHIPSDEGALLVAATSATLSVDRLCMRVQLGRDSANQLVVSDKFASRRHATIELEGVQFRLVDHSANGTYVSFDGSNGELQLLRGETLLYGSGKISLGRSLSDPLAQPIAFWRDQRSLYRM